MSNGRHSHPHSSANRTGSICACGHRNCPAMEYEIEIIDDPIAAQVKHVETDLAPSKDASIEAQYDKSNHCAIIYLDAAALLHTKLSRVCKDGEGFYKSTEIYVLAIDALESPQQGTQREEMLTEIKKASADSIQLAINDLRKMANMCLSCRPEMKERLVFKVRKLSTVLLHGEECTIWYKGARKCRGKLSFSKFSCFSVGGEDFPVFFRIEREDILSNKYRIEKATRETGEDYVEVS